MAKGAVLPLSSGPDFLPLPSDPSMVTDEQRSLAFPGLATVASRIGRDFIEAARLAATPAHAHDTGRDEQRVLHPHLITKEGAYEHRRKAG